MPGQFREASGANQALLDDALAMHVVEMADGEFSVCCVPSSDNNAK